MKKKKILIVAQNGFLERSKLFPEFTIAEKLYQEQKCHVMLAANYLKTSKVISYFEHMKLYRFPKLFANSLPNFIFSFFSSILLLAFARPNMILINHFRSQSFWLIVWAKLFNIKTIVSEAGILHDPYITSDRNDPIDKSILKDNIIYNLTQLITKGINKDNLNNYFLHWPIYNADVQLFFSKHNLSIGRYIGLPNVKYLKHYVNFTHLKRNQKKEKIIINKDYFTPDHKIIFYLGQLKKRKGYDIVLNAAKELCPRNKEIKFVIATSTTNGNAIELVTDFIKKNNLINQVLLLQDISNDERNYLYQRSDLIIIPSRYEGFGLPALESLYFKKLILTTDVPALNEFLINGQNAILFKKDNQNDCNNEIQKIINNKFEISQTLISEGQKTVSEFDIKTVVNFTSKFLSIINKSN